MKNASIRWCFGVLVFSLSACGQSDEELCEDVQKKLRACGQPASSSCPETLNDKVRDQYECIMDVECHELGECAD
jgi:hypothetical protein